MSEADTEHRSGQRQGMEQLHHAASALGPARAGRQDDAVADPKERGRVPAIGRVSTLPAYTRTSGSGEAPASLRPGMRSRNMYGAGLVARSRR